VAVAETWDDLDEIVQLDFVAEWPLTIDALVRVQHLVQELHLTPEQRATFDRVLAYMRDHVQEIADVLGDEYARLALPAK
jgi:hypothetical protein